MELDKNVAAFSAITLCAVALIYYVLWGPPGDATQKSKRNKAGSRDNFIRGLPNPGNACFLNATLQSLASCLSFTTFLTQLLDLSLPSPSPPAKSPLLSAISSLIDYINGEAGGGGTVVDASDVMAAIHSNNCILDGSEQDVHELFHILTTIMRNEMIFSLNLQNKSGLGSLTFQEAETSNNFSSQFHTKFRKVDSRIDKIIPFHGFLATQLVCSVCGVKKPVVFESFDSLSLSIPRITLSEVSVLSCLGRLCGVEIVRSIHCDHCSSVSGDSLMLTPFYKLTWMAKFPRCLVLHIHRTHWLSDGSLVKRNDTVTYPTQLDVSMLRRARAVPNVTAGAVKHHGQHQQQHKEQQQQEQHKQQEQEQQQIEQQQKQQQQHQQGRSSVRRKLYDLRAVICHLGPSDSTGHFITYRRGAHRWYYTSDSCVYEVEEEEALSSQAYILFYELLGK